jgi:hypothetical protein
MPTSALGWELPLDVICINGSFAQIATFAKSRERPIADIHMIEISVSQLP